MTRSINLAAALLLSAAACNKDASATQAPGAPSADQAAPATQASPLTQAAPAKPAAPATQAAPAVAAKPGNELHDDKPPAPSLADVLRLMKNRTQLRQLTPDNVRARLQSIAPALAPDGKSDMQWGFADRNAAGLIESVEINFAAEGKRWQFGDLAVHLQAPDRAQLFAQVLSSLDAQLGKRRWSNPDPKHPEAVGWSIGKGWELSATLEDTSIALVAGEPEGEAED